MTVMDYLRALGALAFVLALMLGCVIALRRWGGDLSFLTPNTKAKPRRLTIVETRLIDAQRKLVLIQRDGVEHLLLLGPQALCVIETIPDQKAPSL